MSEQIHNSQAMTQYLLGALPEAEAERLDELSVTDRGFAEALNVAEKELVDAYVHGDLNGLALDQFRSYYLTSPLRREKVKFAEAFQVFAEKSATAEAGINDSAGREAEQKRAAWSSVLSVFTPRLAWQWGQWGLGAAAVILLVAGGWLVFENVRLRQHASQVQARRDQLLQHERELQKEVDAERSANSAAEQELARLRSERERLEQELEKAKSGRAIPSPGEGNVVSFILAPPLRGPGQIPTLSVPPGASLVKMQLQLEAADYRAYRVMLIDPASNQTLWRSGSLKPGTRGVRRTIAVSFPAGLLKPQNYVLRLTGMPEAKGGFEIVSDYAFKVLK